jgi:hypothetical protein
MWITGYATFARSFFMLLLILLVVPCIINALSRFISQQVQWIKLQLLVKKYSPCLHRSPPSHSTWGLWRLHGSTYEASTPFLSSCHPHCQHKPARWLITPLPNSSWVLVSEGGFIGSDDLRQINGYPILPKEPYHSCILRSYRPAFLHPESKL